MSNERIEITFKVLLVGESGVGKTCFLLRFTDNSFRNNHLSTIGVDFKQKVLEINNKIIRMQIWDTAGQERFQTLTKSYYKLANGVILTYDITDRQSFESIRNWSKQIDYYSDQCYSRILVGNKCDLIDKREVTFEEGENLAKELNIPFYETSAKNNKNINEVFNIISNTIFYSGQLLKFRESEGSIRRFSLLKKEVNSNIYQSNLCSC